MHQLLLVLDSERSKKGTHAHLVEKAFAYAGTNAKRILTVMLSFLIIVSQSWVPMYYILAGIFNLLLSKILKKIVAQPRPKSDAIFNDNGMPSSHSQTMCYFLVILSAITHKYHLNTFLMVPILITLYSYTMMSNYWRIKTEVHSVLQILIGALIGTAIGVLVFFTEESVLYPQALSIQSTIASHIFSQPPPMLPRLLIVAMGLLFAFSREVVVRTRSQRRIDISVYTEPRRSRTKHRVSDFF
eukprot:gene4649-9220_t